MIVGGKTYCVSFNSVYVVTCENYSKVEVSFYVKGKIQWEHILTSETNASSTL